MDIVKGKRHVVSVKMCASGLRTEDGSECDNVGLKDVGGSYLKMSSEAVFVRARTITAYRTHITNTLNLRTGTLIPENTSAKRSIPRPLLLVHSGKTTSGLSAFARIASKLENSAPCANSPGTWPVADSIDSNDAERNPNTLARGVGVRVDEETAAEPVPVRRPGVTRSGEEA